MHTISSAAGKYKPGGEYFYFGKYYALVNFDHLKDSQHIEELFMRYLNDRCTPEEAQLLMNYFNLDGYENQLKGIIQTTLEKQDDAGVNENEAIRKITDRVLNEINKKKKK